MGKRQAIGKSLRFEIFARDGFICQYCGQRPPDVVLELDHIHPCAKGGDNDPLNLITSCADCNRGKRDKVLAEIPRRPDADLKYLEAQQEIAEAERYLDAKQKRDEMLDKLSGAIVTTWYDEIDEASVPHPATINQWIRRYGPQEVEIAIGLAAPKYHAEKFGKHGRWYTNESVAKYVSGILRARAGESGNA